MKFKVGDKVKIRKDLEIGSQYYLGFDFNEYMGKYKGMEAVIIDACPYHYYLDIDDGENCWINEMLEPITENNIESDDNTDESIDQFSKEDFKFGDIVTVRNGCKYIYIPQKNKLFNSDGIGFICLKDFNESLKCIGTSSLDIMKIQRRTYIYYNI